jgi:hypothetical protein
MVEETTYEYTKCRSAHMTLFGGGFFVQPNTIDFDYVFKYADFSDNTTIYSTMIISLATFLILLLWARWKDTRDILVIADFCLLMKTYKSKCEKSNIFYKSFKNLKRRHKLVG